MQNRPIRLFFASHFTFFFSSIRKMRDIFLIVYTFLGPKMEQPSSFSTVIPKKRKIDSEMEAKTEVHGLQVILSPVTACFTISIKPSFLSGFQLSSSSVQNKSEGSHVVNVLNQHQDAIAALEVAAQTLEKDLSLVGRVLKT